MGQCIIKAAPDRDLYLIWSSVVEDAVWVGNRRELAEHLADRDGRAGWRESVRAMIRADRTGTSDRTFRTGHWDDEPLRVMEGAPPRPPGPAGDWYIRRDRLAAYAESLYAASAAAVGWALMEWQEWED